MAGETRGGSDLASRRSFLRAGLYGASLGALAPRLLASTAEPNRGGRPDRILVTVELAGGNDGLDTLIPYRDGAYHQARPTLRHRASDGRLHRLSDDSALHPALQEWKAMWDDGLLAIVQGCGVAKASRSHFTASTMWHTAVPTAPVLTAPVLTAPAPAAPDRAEPVSAAAVATGWLGRLADLAWLDDGTPTLVSVGVAPSPAVRSLRHASVIFSDLERPVRSVMPSSVEGDASSAEGGTSSVAARVRDSVREYRTPIDYGRGQLAIDLRRIAALVASGFPARVYTTSLGGFDTHAAQAEPRRRLLAGVATALRAFHRDLRRLGHGGEVATLVYSEFGRRLEENVSLGTDHGTVGPVFLLGDGLVPGLFGRPPSLTELDRDGDLAHTTDFRRVYASVIEEWFGWRDTAMVLRRSFEPLGIFAARAS